MTVRVKFSTVFISLEISYFADVWLPKHPFILGLTFMYKIPRTMLVLSGMEYISIIINGGSKMEDPASSFL